MGNTTPERPHVFNHEEPADYLKEASIDRSAYLPDQKMLIVTYRETELQLDFIILSSTSENPENGGTATIRGGLPSIQDRLKYIASFLNQASRREYQSVSSQESLLKNLQGIGRRLFLDLIPTVLQQTIQSWINGTWLSVSTNEQWIPWELLYDGHGFLGQRFMLFRIPRLASNKGRLQRRQKKAAPTPPLKILHAVGGNLQREDTLLCMQHFNDVSTSLIVKLLHEGTLTNFIDEILDADIVHLTCHGHLNPLRLQLTRADDQLTCLTIDSFKTAEFAMQNGCLVFANACGSAAAEYQFGEFVSFGWEFYLKGASIFIGTLGTIPTKTALTFADAFYKTLTTDTNGDICRAYRIAKDRTDGGSPLPLLYCFYGNPLSILPIVLNGTRSE